MHSHVETTHLRLFLLAAGLRYQMIWIGETKMKWSGSQTLRCGNGLYWHFVVGAENPASL